MTDTEINHLQYGNSSMLQSWNDRPTTTYYDWLLYNPLYATQRQHRDKLMKYPAYTFSNIGNHYEPVLAVSEDIQSRAPYIDIENFVPRKYEQHISSRLLKSVLAISESSSMLAYIWSPTCKIMSECNIIMFI